jgi:hypothetical protein
VFVEAFVAKSAVKALDERILRRLPRLNEVQTNATIARPTEHRDAAHLGAVPLANQIAGSAGHRRSRWFRLIVGKGRATHCNPNATQAVRRAQAYWRDRRSDEAFSAN